jgi:hypothetical protein
VVETAGTVEQHGSSNKLGIAGSHEQAEQGADRVADEHRRLPHMLPPKIRQQLGPQLQTVGKGRLGRAAKPQQIQSIDPVSRRR